MEVNVNVNEWLNERTSEYLYLCIVLTLGHGFVFHTIRCFVPYDHVCGMVLLKINARVL